MELLVCSTWQQHVDTKRNEGNAPKLPEASHPCLEAKKRFLAPSEQRLLWPEALGTWTLVPSAVIIDSVVVKVS